MFPAKSHGYPQLLHFLIHKLAASFFSLMGLFANFLFMQWWGFFCFFLNLQENKMLFPQFLFIWKDSLPISETANVNCWWVCQITPIHSYFRQTETEKWKMEITVLIFIHLILILSIQTSEKMLLFPSMFQLQFNLG